MNKILCENCREIIEPIIKAKESKSIIRGKEYEYIAKIGICPKCKSEIITNEMIDENLQSLDKVYREKEGIIKQEDIEKILKKYRIGKKPLSKLLGWGEITITRYLDGDVPSRIYSDELKRILTDEKYMSEILEKNKNNISCSTYKSVYNALGNLKIGTNDSIKDIDLATQYIIEKCQEITPLALQKLLYYAQGFYKVFWGDFLFSENCEAWIHGPVYSNIYEEYKKYGSDIIDRKEIKINAEEYLNDDKKTLLDVIVTSFGFYSGKALEKMTHYEEPWILARKGANSKEKGNNVITKESMEKYFTKVKEKYNMANIIEIRKYSEELFNNAILFDK